VVKVIENKMKNIVYKNISNHKVAQMKNKLKNKSQKQLIQQKSSQIMQDSMKDKYYYKLLFKKILFINNLLKQKRSHKPFIQK